MTLKRIVLSMLLFLPVLAIAQNDTIIAINGDDLHGEIKRLERGILYYSTDYSDKDFQIEWDEVTEVHTDRTFLIILTDGRRLNGTIDSYLGDPPVVAILGETGFILIDNLSEITFLLPVEKSFLGRMDASIELGYSFTKTQNHHTFNVRSNVGYTANYWGAEAGFDAIRSKQDSVAPTRRTDANVGVRTFLGNSWYLLLSNNFLQSDEAKLRLRSTTNLSIGHLIINTSKTAAGAGIGIAYNYETFTSDAPDEGSLEGLIKAEINLFAHENISLLSTFKVYPGITVRGRVRSDFRFDIKYDLPLDFFIKFGFTHNYDNRPVEGASTFDYVVQTTFGWEL